jgi:hypothetical protein
VHEDESNENTFSYNLSTYTYNPKDIENLGIVAIGYCFREDNLKLRKMLLE